jgi:hypothetical protein
MSFLRVAVIYHVISHATIRKVLRLITSISMGIDLVSLVPSTTTATTPASPLIIGSVGIGRTIWVDVEGFLIGPLFTVSMVLAIILICRLESSTSGGHIVEFTERADSLFMLLACAGVHLALSLPSCIRRDVSDGYMTT